MSQVEREAFVTNFQLPHGSLDSYPYSAAPQSPPEWAIKQTTENSPLIYPQVVNDNQLPVSSKFFIAPKNEFSSCNVFRVLNIFA